MYMTVLENGKNAMEVSYKKPLCLVIGSEATGISKDIRQYGELITLPQPDPEASFNASVAAGIFLFLLFQGAKPSAAFRALNLVECFLGFSPVWGEG